VKEDPHQQWYINPTDGTLYNAANSDKALDFADPKNVQLTQHSASSNSQKGFDYTHEDQFSIPSGLVMTYDRQDKRVKFMGNQKENNQFWHVEYCYNFVPI
jgi:hypothetical protein